MTSQRTASTTLFAGLLAGAVLGGIGIGYADTHSPGSIPPLATAIAAAAVMLLACAAAIPLWRRMDEVARAAHQSAWYWGGSIGSGLAGGLAVYAVRETPAALADRFPTLTLNTAFGAGVLACLAIQVAVYGLGWIVWWMSKR